MGQAKVSPSWFCAGAVPLNISSASLLHVPDLAHDEKLGLVLRGLNFQSALIPALQMQSPEDGTGDTQKWLGAVVIVVLRAPMGI